MAGFRHHILPRFLLKGFASRIEGEKVFTNVYRKDSTHFETTIENVSVERHFYGKRNGLSADDEITALEANYANLIGSLREKNDKTQVSDPRIPAFIAHLAVRTKHIREFFRDSTEYLLDQLTDYLTDFENLKRLLLGNPELVKEEFAKFFQNAPIEQSQRDAVWTLVELYLPVLMDQQRTEFEALAQTFMSEIKGVFPKAVNEGHIKALAKNPVPKPRVEEYGKLTWFVCDTLQPLVLGDTGCLFEIAGPKKFRPMDDKGDEILKILLPVSSHKILVGSSHSVAPELDAAILNTAFSCCSLEYFVCSESSPEKTVLAASIGRCSGVVSKEELHELVGEILKDARSGGLR